jgi:phosphoglycerate kinase
VVLSHQGRKGDPDYTSLKQHAQILQQILNSPVKFVDDLFGDKAKNAIKQLKDGEILVLENVRSWQGETKKGSPEQQAKTEMVQILHRLPTCLSLTLSLLRTVTTFPWSIHSGFT